MKAVKIGHTLVGDGQPCYFIAEIGINHNGDVEIAKKLIDVAEAAGCNAVKFQKRTPELCVPAAQRDLMRETPWGYITYLEYRKKVEFGRAEYIEIDKYCQDHDIEWFASCWDEPSVDFMEEFSPPCYKIASASLTDNSLLKKTRETGRPLLLSTGMSTFKMINRALEVLNKDNLVLIHTVSTYPAHYEELNLKAIHTLRDRYHIPIGYSGHETGIASTVAAVALGACLVERHITLDRAMWGSDHSASLEPSGLTRLLRDIRLVERSMGTGEKAIIDREIPIMKRLRKES